MADMARQPARILPESIEPQIRNLQQDSADTNLNRLTSDLKNLQDAWQHDRIVAAHIKMLTAMVSYLKSKGTGSHKKTLPTLNLIFNQLNILVRTPENQMTDDFRKDCLSKSLGRFNALKKELSQSSHSSPTQYRQNHVHVSELDTLKTILFSMDWEISDAVLDQLNRELTELKTRLRHDSLCLSLVQMLGSIGKYIQAKKAGAHPGAVGFCHTLFNTLETIVQTPDMTQVQRKRILAGAVTQFNELKARIAATQPHTPASSSRSTHDPASIREGNHFAERGHPKTPVSPIDELISTKSDTQSPVDDLVDQIHLLNVFDTSKPVSSKDEPGSPSLPPDIREITPDRSHAAPIEEIEARLDDFFDEDQLLSELSFADGGDEVVPYEPGKTTEASGPAESGWKRETLPDQDDEAIAPHDYDDMEFTGTPPDTTAEMIRQIREHLHARDPENALKVLGELKPVVDNYPNGRAAAAMLASTLTPLARGGHPFEAKALEVAQQLCESLDTKSSTPSSVGHQTLSFPADTLLGYINLQDTLIFTLSSTASVARSLPEHDGVAGAESEHAAMDHTLTATNPSPLPDPQGQPLTESPEPETKTGFFSRIRAFFSSGNT